MRFHDRAHRQAVENAERSDPSAQQVIKDFCELINLPYQQQQGLFAVGYYTSFLAMPPQRTTTAQSATDGPAVQPQESSTESEPGAAESAESAPAASPEAGEVLEQIDLDAEPTESAEDPLPADEPPGRRDVGDSGFDPSESNGTPARDVQPAPARPR
jgi:hypothetical protein